MLRLPGQARAAGLPSSRSCHLVLEAALLETALLETALLETALLETALLETALLETALLEAVPPGRALIR